jgi:large-conductance mechanosensitive channel
MQDNQKKTSKNEEKGGPKFNYFWIYGIIAVILIGLNFFWPSSNVKPIDRNRLEKIIRANDLPRRMNTKKKYPSLAWAYLPMALITFIILAMTKFLKIEYINFRTKSEQQRAMKTLTSTSVMSEELTGLAVS